MDVAINPRQVIAEEFVRFAHDPRIRQIAMLEGDRFEILDLTVRSESELAGRRFDDLPADRLGDRRDDPRRQALFPHGTDTLLSGDRVIIFVESRRAALVEKVL